MNIVTRYIDNLQPYERNPKTHSADQIDLLARSIKEFGWTVPVLIDSESNVVAGHGRIEAARRLGMMDVPTIQLADLTPEQVRAYRIADNKLTELGGWDTSALQFEFGALNDVGFDLELTGFDIGEIGRLMPGADEADETPEPPDNPVAQPGDLWTLGEHRLICGDSTDAATVARVLDGEKPALMVTDPPYGVEYDPDWRNRYETLFSGRTGSPTARAP